MSLPECAVETNNVQKLADSPTESAKDLKKVFDKAGEDLRKYINDELIPEIEKADKETENNTKN